MKKCCSQADGSPVVWCRKSCCPSPHTLARSWCERVCVKYRGRVALRIKKPSVLLLFSPKTNSTTPRNALDRVEASTKPHVTSSHVVSGAKARMVASPQQRFLCACDAWTTAKWFFCSRMVILRHGGTKKTVKDRRKDTRVKIQQQTSPRPSHLSNGGAGRERYKPVHGVAHRCCKLKTETPLSF